MDFYLGQINMFGFNFAPQQWAFCAGQLLAIQTNTALFSLLGTTYGGNGTTTFALPDLRGRFPNNQGQGPGQPNYVIGQQSGTTQVTLQTSNLPPHNHLMQVNGATGTTAKPGGAFLAQSVDVNSAAVQVYSPSGSAATLNAAAITLTGQSIPFAIMPPYLTINFCIALQGIFPPRN